MKSFAIPRLVIVVVVSPLSVFFLFGRSDGRSADRPARPVCRTAGRQAGRLAGRPACRSVGRPGRPAVPLIRPVRSAGRLAGQPVSWPAVRFFFGSDDRTAGWPTGRPGRPVCRTAGRAQQRKHARKVLLFYGLISP